MQLCDPDAPAAASLVNQWGFTGLHVAAGASDLAVCKLLLIFGAHVDFHETLERVTPLMHALRTGASVEVLKLLLDAHACPNSKDGHGGTPLHYAAAKGEVGLQVVTLLVRKRADANLLDNRGASCLAVAGFAEAPGVVRFLLSSGASPQSCRTVLHLMPGEPAEDPVNRSCRQILEAVL